mmetsp:Transcript_25637/g.78879  ORF Transcript_25637/g.78879 Transcript_25637/m.78879 type:complete len:243 (+) Transcript_25637:1420-2148(+)
MCRNVRQRQRQTVVGERILGQRQQTHVELKRRRDRENKTRLSAAGRAVQQVPPAIRHAAAAVPLAGTDPVGHVRHDALGDAFRQHDALERSFAPRLPERPPLRAPARHQHRFVVPPSGLALRSRRLQQLDEKGRLFASRRTELGQDGRRQRDALPGRSGRGVDGAVLAGAVDEEGRAAEKAQVPARGRHELERVLLERRHRDVPQPSLAALQPVQNPRVRCVLRRHLERRRELPPENVRHEA